MTDDANGWEFSLYYVRLQSALETAVSSFETSWSQYEQLLANHIGEPLSPAGMAAMTYSKRSARQ